MDRWHYNDKGQQRGPIHLDELRELLSTGKLSSDTLVWTEGMPEWKPAASIESLQISPYAPPASSASSVVNWDDEEVSGPQVRPWARYWARSMDYLLFCSLVGGVGFWLWPEVSEVDDTFLGVALLLIYNFVEPIFLTVFGTTPFKALLRIRIRTRDGSKLSYLQGLSRCFAIWLRGEGLGIPIATLITSIMSYNRLSGEGITSWDQNGGFRVTHQTIQWWRWLLLVASIVGFSYLIGSAD